MHWSPARRFRALCHPSIMRCWSEWVAWRHSNLLGWRWCSQSTAPGCSRGWVCAWTLRRTNMITSVWSRGEAGTGGPWVSGWTGTLRRRYCMQFEDQALKSRLDSEPLWVRNISDDGNEMTWSGIYEMNHILNCGRRYESEHDSRS